MDPSRVCGDAKTLRTPRHKCAPTPSLPPDTYQCQHWHPLALKLGCAGLILLFLSLIGLSVLVRFLVQKSPTEKYSVSAQENRTEPIAQANEATTVWSCHAAGTGLKQNVLFFTLGRSVILMCSRDWHPYHDKCLHLSQTSGPWSEGLTYCSVKEATLLLIENEEELRFIHDFSGRKRQQFFIGLNYVPLEKTWKWINGSILNPDLLRIMGTEEENSCAVISQKEVFSDFCSSDNRWICQKKLNHDCNPCPDS
uniref:killer cell lectin-like receptor subfamily B member 1F isoform X2 n=1 Tax=Myodes glareolus TaxID=447135 RepID=UPI0020224EAF|nr:killer cell lectin-like receptor subfamily B member 1F isoform X2 [Myodes glareolus]